MLPDTPDHPTRLLRVEAVEDQLPVLRSQVLGCLDVEAFGAALQDAGWSLNDEVGIILEIAKNSDSDKDRLNALDLLQKRRMDALRYSGHLARLTAVASTDETGRTVQTLTASTMRLRNDAISDTERALRRAAQNPQEIIDVECSVRGNEPVAESAPGTPAAESESPQEQAAGTVDRDGSAREDAH